MYETYTDAKSAWNLKVSQYQKYLLQYLFFLGKHFEMYKFVKDDL